MTSLDGLRSRLQRAREERQLQQRDDTQGNTTERLTDLTSWQVKIQEQGNQPKDWLELITFVSKNLTFPDVESRQRHLACLYDRGLKAMQADSCKYDEAYARFLIRYAQFKSFVCKDEAREMFSQARVTVKSHAIVHIAAAQFELSQGNKGKCRKILEKAKEVQAKPGELLNAAFRNFVNEKTVLLSSDEQSNSGKENKIEERRLSKSGSLDSESGNSSQDSSAEILITKKTARPALQEIVPSTPKHPHPAGEISFSTKQLDSTISFKLPSVRTANRNRHISQDSDDADTVPIAFDSSMGSYPMGSATKPNLRSYHSTPDCKSQGPTSQASTSKRKFVGKAMRIPKPSLVRVLEVQPDQDDDALMECSLLHDSSDGASTGGVDTSVKRVTGTMKSTSLSPPTEDSGVADLQTRPSETTRDPSPVVQPKPKRQNTNTEEPVFKEPVPEQKPPIPVMEPLSQNPSPAPVPNPQPSTRPPKNPEPSAVPPICKERKQSTSKEAVPTRPVVPKASPVVQSTPPAPVSQPSKSQRKEPVVQPSRVQEIAAPVQSTANAPNVVQIAGDLLTVKGKSYFILNTVGRGGSSKVYKVIDFVNKHELAVKHVKLEGVGESALTGYLNEITLLKRLQYSNRVIKLYDFEYNAATQSLYVVMEVGNTDLATLFRSYSKQEQLTPIMIQFYWMEMLKCVQVLHKEGIIHSDLKPANFILVAGKLKLIDFGIANAIQDDHTSVVRDTQVGTLNFMSPESILGHNIESPGAHRPQFKLGVKSDVWSLGCILYNMVYGKTPFQHITNQLAKLHAITNPQFKISFPEMDNKELVSILKSCLLRDPKIRPNIDELLERPWLL